MRKYPIIIVLVAIVLLLTNSLALLLLLLVLLPAHYAWKWKERKAQKATTDRLSFATLEDATARLGQPDDIVVLNATQGNEPAGTILFYDEARLMVIRGTTYPYAAIRDISYVNAATPYSVDQYQVLIYTDEAILRLPVGYDGEFAAAITSRLYAHLHPTETPT